MGDFAASNQGLFGSGAEHAIALDLGDWMADLFKTVNATVTNKTGILHLSITAGLRQYVMCRADYRYALDGGKKSPWMPIDHFNRHKGDISREWPVSDCSKLAGAEICVQFVVARLETSESDFRLKAALSVGGSAISGAEITFAEKLAANAASRDAWFYLS